MCVFINEIRVSDTSILARRTAPDRQILVYSMKVYSDEPTAMILPLPIVPSTDGETINFIDLSGYENYFEDMHIACDAVSYTLEAGMSGEMLFYEQSLPVHSVGDFEASFVPQLTDFHRLDKRFQLPDDLWNKMPEYNDYGFAVFQLKPMSSLFSEFKEIHPMAFEFTTRDCERLFFPTVHVHDDQFHPRAEFDHTMFMQFDDDNIAHSKITSMYNTLHEREASEAKVIGYEPGEPELMYIKTESGYVNSYGIAKECMKVDQAAGTLNPEQRIYGLMAKGELKNQDTWV